MIPRLICMLAGHRWGLNFSDRNRYALRRWRCTRCGYTGDWHQP